MSPSNTADKVTTRKIRHSCSACSSSKVKCDQAKPSCARCRVKGWQCKYEPSRRCGPRGPRCPRREPTPTIQRSVEAATCHESADVDAFRDFTWIRPSPLSTPHSQMPQVAPLMLSPDSTGCGSDTNDLQIPTANADLLQGHEDLFESSVMFDSPVTNPSNFEDDTQSKAPDPATAIATRNLLATNVDNWYSQTTRSCDCLTRLLSALTLSAENRSALSTNFSQSNTHEVNVTVLNIATEVGSCDCFSANESLFFLLVYAVVEVLATYATEAARLSFEGSICVDATGEEEVVRMANATLVFGEMPRVTRVLEMLGKGSGSGQRYATVDELRQRLIQVRRTAWESIRPLNNGWSDLLS